jgi:nucleolar protein 14
LILADFVGDAHFGGFLSKKEETEGTTQSRQNLIQELIAESKKRKAEKQKENEKTAEMTDKLDTDWKDLQSIIYNSKVGLLLPFWNNILNPGNFQTKKQKTDEEEGIKPKIDDYDKAVRQLTYESRGIVN